MRVLPLALGLASLLTAGSPEFDRAQKLFVSTEFEQSIKVLDGIPDKDASVYELIGRDYYLLGDFKKASENLEKAAAAAPASSEIALWAGRAFGRRAETSNMLTAPSYANRTRQYFEKAVQLNPRNLDALSDLFEYYIEAPGFLGGGLDKAEAIAAQIARIDAGEGYSSNARLAEKRKQYDRAEEQLRRAVDASPQRIGRLIELAKFFARQGRFQEADQMIARAEQISPNSPKLLYAKADLYIRGKRNLTVARDLLHRYMTMNLSPDDPPRSEAARLLRQVQGS